MCELRTIADLEQELRSTDRTSRPEGTSTSPYRRNLSLQASLNFGGMDSSTNPRVRTPLNGPALDKSSLDGSSPVDTLFTQPPLSLPSLKDLQTVELCRSVPLASETRLATSRALSGPGQPQEHGCLAQALNDRGQTMGRTRPQVLNNRGRSSPIQETHRYASWATSPPRHQPRKRSCPVLPRFPLPPRPRSLPSVEAFTTSWTSHYVRIAPHVIIYHLVSFYLPSCGNAPAFVDGTHLELAHQTAESALAAINDDADDASVALHRPTRPTILACARLLGVRTSLVEAGFTFYRRAAVEQRLDTAEDWIYEHPEGPQGRLALRVAEDTELLKACGRAIHAQGRWASRVGHSCGKVCGRIFHQVTDRSPPQTKKPDLTLSKQVVQVKLGIEAWMREVCEKVCAITLKGRVGCAFEARDLMHGRRRSSILSLGRQSKGNGVIMVTAVRSLNAKCEDEERTVHWIPSTRQTVKTDKTSWFGRKSSRNSSVDIWRTPDYGVHGRAATGRGLTA